MKTQFAAIVAVVCACAFLGSPVAYADCGEPKFFVDEAKLPFDPLPDPGMEAVQYWGVHKEAGYRIEVPLAWNGDVVLWAHGFAGTGPELTVENPPHRAWLIANGYAWAASSYSKNGYDVGQAARDMRALSKKFKRIAGKPDRIFITGFSMGSHAIAVAIERWPHAFDGAMPMCGNLADYGLFDFSLDFNAVAQALAGMSGGLPPGPDYMTTTVPATKAALEMYPGTYPYVLNAQGEKLKDVIAVRSGGPRPLFDQGFAFWNGVVVDFLFSLVAQGDIFNGQMGMVVDNTDTVYQFDTDPTLTPDEQALNDTVQRIVGDPRNPRRLNNIPVVHGDIAIPVLTLHTIGDLYIPLAMEQVYALRVAEHGASDLLVQRAIRDFIHCTFTPEEMIAGFTDLVAWVDTGVRPVGDDLLDPAAVADPSFGCAFTSEDRAYPPGPLFVPPCSGPQ